jgi:hypothetical protein
MSKHINMTGHYHVAGRERQGEDILQSSEKRAYSQQRQEARREAIETKAGPPAWETTPPNLEVEEKSKPRTRRKASKPGGRRKAQRTPSGESPRTAKRVAKPARKMTRTTRKATRKTARATSRSTR